MDGRWLAAAALMGLGASAALRGRGSRALTPNSRAAELSQGFQKQFRDAWDEGAWEALVRGPVARLARSLERAGEDETTVDSTLEAVLRLLGEAQGHGYLADPEGVFGQIWRVRVPAELVSVPPSRRFALLAELWNASEGLVRLPAWKVRVFRQEVSLDGVPLEGLASAIVRGEQVFTSDAGLTLGASPTVVHWIRFETDPSFLPGELYLRHPRLVLVTDRLSPRTEAVWFSRTEGPIAVGAFAKAPVRPVLHSGVEVWNAIAKSDPAVTRRYHSIGTPAWSIASLVTSRYLLCAVPEVA
jgi:hypothetical protein